MAASAPPLMLSDAVLIQHGGPRRLLLCARCFAPAASPSVQLSLVSGNMTRRQLRAGATPPGDGLPRLQSGCSEQQPCWCALSDTCTEVYCSVACRELCEGAHALLCEGGLPAHAPLRELQRVAASGGEAIRVTASLVATAVAERREVSWLNEWTDDGGHDGNAPDDEACRTRDAAVEEAWALLRVGVLERLPGPARAAAEALLERPLFERLVATLERRLCPLEACCNGSIHTSCMAYCSSTPLDST